VRFPARRETTGRRRTEDTGSTARQVQLAPAGARGLRVLWPPHRRGRGQGRRGRLDHRAPGPQDQDRDRHDQRRRWTSIEYTDAIYDEQTQTWVSRAEVAEIDFTAFAAQKKANHVPGRLVVRRIPDLNPGRRDGQETLFDTWRFHAFFTTTDHQVADTVTADKTHRGHAIIEQVHADLKDSALAHLPSGKFTANAAWLVLAVMAFNLTRAAGTTTGPTLARSTTATIRRKLINVPARIASSARRVTLHLPAHWPWEIAWSDLFTSARGPPPAPTI
jgi:hypothetical protein